MAEAFIISFLILAGLGAAIVFNYFLEVFYDEFNAND